jgi:hypothetical protein
MGQLESLRELSTVEPNNKRKKKDVIVIHSDRTSSES